jgi:hypothetical protein
MPHNKQLQRTVELHRGAAARLCTRAALQTAARRC